jgi:hypothetical protein
MANLQAINSIYQGDEEPRASIEDGELCTVAQMSQENFRPQNIRWLSNAIHLKKLFPKKNWQPKPQI